VPVSCATVPGSRRTLSIATATAVVVASLVSACGGGNDNKSSTASNSAGASGATRAGTTGAGSCAAAQNPAPKRVRRQSKPKLILSAGKKYSAAVVTNCGSFTIKLDPRQAPKTGGSFVSLVRKHFYDGLTFHRVIPGFLIQAGDPTGTGMGDPGYSIREAPPKDVVYSEGVVAMGKSQTEAPGTSGSQFFVVTSNDAQVAPDYALLGKVSKGLGVVHRIEAVPTGPTDAPVQPVIIKRITVKTG
jgi:cyclophilin family peptidyl-prolyl cis-trans isomerase